MLWGVRAVTFVFLLSTVFVPGNVHASLPFFSQDRNYLNWISSLIYADLFVTDPTITVATGSDPQLEIFFIQNNDCVDTSAPLTYRLLVKNIGDEVAKDLFITAHYTHSTLESTQRKADTIDPSTQTIIWTEPALIPGDFISYALSILPSGSTPVEVTGAIEYTNKKVRRISTTQHVISTRCSSVSAQKKFLKKLWPL